MKGPYREIEKITEPIRKRLKEISASTLVMQQTIEPTLLKIQKSFENINDIYISIPKFENPIFGYLNTFKEIGERLKEYAEKTPEYFLLIAQHGWFIDLESELNFAPKVAYEIQTGELTTANELLVKYYRDNLEQIFDRLIKRHPNRKEILTQVFSAYRNEYHSLLIPSTLTQVDGICFDFTKRKFFIKEKENKYLPQVTSELEKSAGTFLDLYLSPLQNQIPIMVREPDISKFPCHLNRHEILHGINLEYGTEINSLKVISLLKYVSDLLTGLDTKTLGTIHRMDGSEKVKNSEKELKCNSSDLI